MKLIHQVIKIRSIRTSPSLIDKLNNMETKELKIQAPKGYEIDKENSTFECIRFKPIKNITYDAVCNVIFSNDTYFITDRGYVHKDAKWDNEIIPDKNIASNEKQLKRLLSLNQLLNIAEYYNSKRASYVSTVIIYYSEILGRYNTAKVKSTYNNGVQAMFKQEEDAQAVIDNPNFREILDTIYKG